MYEFFMSLQDSEKDYYLRNYEVFDTQVHNEGRCCCLTLVKKWLVKSRLVNISSYLSKKYIKEAEYYRLSPPEFNPRVLRPLFQSQHLTLSILLLERVTYLRKFLGHLRINDQYVSKYFDVSFLDPFVLNLAKLFSLVRKNPGAQLAQEEIQNKLKFRKKDRKRLSGIIKSSVHFHVDNKWGQGFFRQMSNQFGVDVEFLDIYQQIISANSQLSCHRDLPLKVELIRIHSWNLFDFSNVQLGRPPLKQVPLVKRIFFVFLKTRVVLRELLKMWGNCCSILM
jgi:hypothetical protein